MQLTKVIVSIYYVAGVVKLIEWRQNRRQEKKWQSIRQQNQVLENHDMTISFGQAMA